ncbi:hypothetical protein [Sphaerothrix gracilis]|uniref:hypothetical protein n=1 Tax=Sphaerothrix gracilis TaxID=3151835 RepID=UPI0031FC6077
MENISIVLRGSGISSEYKLDISPDIRIIDFRLNAQTLVGYDDDSCQLVIERTGDFLPDGLLVSDTDIQSGDVLIVLPPVVSTHSSLTAKPSTYKRIDSYGNQASFDLTVSYKLLLETADEKKNMWEYTVHLQSCHENNPSRFFKESDRKEQRKLEEFVEKALDRQPSSTEIRKILDAWCEDILLGYRETFFTLQK